MRPHKPTTKSKASAQARARLLMRSGLGWLGGYPQRGQPLGWVVVPELGSGRPVDRVVVERASLRRATLTARKLYREFPRALTTLVGDRDRWLERTLAVLEQLKPSVHSGVSLPDVGELASLLCSQRTAQAVVRARRSDSPRSIVEALAWVFLSDEPALRAALRWATAHAQPLAVLVERRDGLVLAVRLAQLATAESSQRVEALLAALTLEGVFTTPLEAQPGSASKVAKRRRGKAGRWPERPKAKLGGELVALVAWVARLTGRPRRRALELLPWLMPTELLADWSRWWQRHDRLVGEAKGCVAITPIGPEQSRRLSEIIKTLQKSSDNMPPAVDVPLLFGAIRSTAGGPHARTIIDTLPLLPHATKGRLVRIAFFLLWHYLMVQADSPQQAARLITAFRRFIAAQPDVIAALAPWECYWRGEGAPLRGYHEALDSDLLDEPTAKVDAVYEALAASYARHGLAGAPLWRAGKLDRRMLLHLAGLTRDGVRTERLLEALRERGTLKKVRYVPYSLAKATLDLCGAEDERFAPLLETLHAAEVGIHDYGDEDALGLASVCGDQSMATRLAGLALRGEVKRLCRLGGRLRLVRALGAESVAFSPLPAHGRGRPRWMDRYPTAFRLQLAALARVDEQAEATADRLLGKSFPDPLQLQRQIAVIRTRLDGCADAQAACRLQKRLSNLQARRDEEPQITPRRLATLEAKLVAMVDSRAVRSWEKRLDEEIGRALWSKLGVSELPVWVLEPPCFELLPHLCELAGRSRQLAFWLLRARARSYPWDLRDKPANRDFVAMLRRHGIESKPWLDGIGVVVRETQRGPVHLQLERDPLEILLMGKHFETCLSPGWFNFFSAVSNAADINKRVLYARDSGGVVIGRCLLALTDRGHVLTFHPYCHHETWGFRGLVGEFVAVLADRMGTSLADRGHVPKLLANDWYDDGPVDLTDQFEALRQDGTLYQSLARIEPDKLLDALQRALAPLGLNAVTIPVVLALPPVKQRPELVVPLLDLIAAERELAVGYKELAAGLAWQAGACDAARRMVRLAVLPVIERTARPGQTIAETTLELMTDLGEASLMLRLLRSTRPRGIRRWSDEHDPVRIYFAGRAHELLHRPKRATELYRRVKHQGPSEQLRRACDERLAKLVA